MATTAFADMWGRARTRLLNRNARKAAEHAEYLRRRKGAFPEFAGELEAEAVRLDEYADRCRAAAADHTLPTPELTDPKEGDRG